MKSGNEMKHHYLFVRYLYLHSAMAHNVRCVTISPLIPPKRQNLTTAALPVFLQFAKILVNKFGPGCGRGNKLLVLLFNFDRKFL